MSRITFPLHAFREFQVLSTFIAIESLIKSTPFTFATNSMECSASGFFLVNSSCFLSTDLLLILQCLHCFFKLIAAVLVIFKKVETCTARRQQYSIAFPAELVCSMYRIFC